MKNNNIPKKLGYKIRLIRTERKLSQEGLAYNAKLNMGYVSMLECGKANVTINKLTQIANALDVDIKDLFDFTIDSLM